MKKYSWIVALLLALSFTTFFTGCGVDPVEGGGGAFETTDIAGKIQAWGSNQPEIDGNTVEIEASSSTGFYIKFADIGYDFSRKDSLIFSYEIDISAPEACLQVKNASNSSDWVNPSASGGAGYGAGKGWEYFLGSELNDGKLSTYDGPVVSGTYNDATKKGTFEVKLSVFGAGMTAIGFQHNYWAEYPQGTKVSENAKYKLKITKIENKVGGEPEPEFDTAAFNNAKSIQLDQLTNEWGLLNSITIDDKSGIIYRKAGYGAGLFSIKIPTVVETIGSTDTIAVKYHALQSVPAAKLVGKVPSGSDWNDVGGGLYIDLNTTGRLAEFSVPFAGIYTDSGVSKVAFQDNDWQNPDSVWRMKVVGVEVRRQGKQAVTLRDIKFAAPVAGRIPDTKIIETAQYTGTISYTTALADKKIASKNEDGDFILANVFDYNKTYTPVITLTAKDGYIFDSDNIGATNVAAFKVNGVTATNPALAASNTSITVTGQPVTTTGSDAAISQKALTGIAVPSVGAEGTALTTAAKTGVQNIAANNTQFRVKSIAWYKTEDDTALGTGNFAVDTAYYAVVVLTPLFGYTGSGVAFTAPGATSVTATTITPAPETWETALKVSYPATEKTITNTEIKGLKAASAGQAPVRSITADSQFTGKVRWFRVSDSSELVSGNFVAGVAYKAIVELTPKAGWTVQGLAADSFTVTGATAASDANSGIVTVTW